MQHIEIFVPPSANLARAETLVEGVLVAAGVRAALKASLASCPGSVHWHLKQGNEAGTLEVTLWPRTRRLWISIQDGRNAPWVRAAPARLGPALTTALARETGP